MKKIRNTIVLVTLLATSSVMACKNSDNNNGYKMNKQSCMQKQQHKKGPQSEVSHFILKTVHHMDLTKNQQSELLKIEKKFKKSKFTGFSENGFDKKLFITSKIKTREDRVKEEANFIESVYKILDKNQITYIGMKIQSMEKHREMRKFRD